MNKLTILMCLICFVLVCFLSACVNTNSGNKVLQYQRKFGNLGQPQKTEPSGIIDLSDGTKVNFDIMPNSSGVDFGIK